MGFREIHYLNNDAVDAPCNEFPGVFATNLGRFNNRKNEINVEDDVLLWGHRVIIPFQLREVILKELHATHLGIVKMKYLARSYFWWPSLNDDIESVSRSLRTRFDMLRPSSVQDNEKVELENVYQNIQRSQRRNAKYFIGNRKIPTTPESWLDVAKQFEKTWNFPHCLGALDGKHVVIQAPCNTGSEFFNYKSTFSVVLFALVDANYNFLYVNAGGQGRISDGGIFKDCSLYKKLVKNQLNFPEPETLKGMQRKIPYFFIGDEAFAFTDSLMKPFSGTHLKGSIQRIFNYRLSRARRTVENPMGRRKMNTEMLTV
ncbi:unnamed protein product [Acanthoscelides obtectus]|uniref:RNA-directed DNA polymerase n=1 Tax=Acanthoscelides obtectus TaxID=200917 RepID=A0A9P0LJ36_ACAOB|nr:unnamed protein product [Acanthoscelides obtectus]CAK1650154.1 Protein ALP1-like [Acanthoscelides obtectus]